MSNGRDVLDHGNFETDSLKRTDGGFTALAGATLEGKTYTLVKDEDAEDTDEKDDSVWSYGDESADIEELSSAISALTADSFTDTAEAGKQEIALTLYLRNEQFPTVSVVLCRYNGTSCVAKVDGKVTALVPRSQVVDLIEAVNGIVL